MLSPEREGVNKTRCRQCLLLFSEFPIAAAQSQARSLVSLLDSTALLVISSSEQLTD